MEIKFYDKDNRIVVNKETLIFDKWNYEKAKARYLRMLKKEVSNGK